MTHIFVTNPSVILADGTFIGTALLMIVNEVTHIGFKFSDILFSSIVPQCFPIFSNTIHYRAKLI